MAGVAGLEPAHIGTKTRCLTIWRYPYKTAGVDLHHAYDRLFFVATLYLLSVYLFRHRSSHGLGELSALKDSNLVSAFAAFCRLNYPSLLTHRDISIPRLT